MHILYIILFIQLIIYIILYVHLLLFLYVLGLMCDKVTSTMNDSQLQ